MSLKDLIQSQKTLADVDSINKALENIQSVIAGKMVNLTAEAPEVRADLLLKLHPKYVYSLPDVA